MDVRHKHTYTFCIKRILYGNKDYNREKIFVVICDKFNVIGISRA